MTQKSPSHSAPAPGPLALVGGNELNPGNESQDRVLVAAAGDGPAFVLATAAGSAHAAMAIRHATQWFRGLGLEVTELPAVRRREVAAPRNAERARGGRFFYLVGGDPGRVPATLAGTVVWDAVVGAWLNGAALAGSSAGAMALGEWTLTRHTRPGDAARDYRPGFGLIPGVAVIPHFDTFGKSWVEGSLASRPRPDAVLIGIDEASAALWHGGVWTAYGPGGVTVFSGQGRARFDAGATIEGIPQPTREVPAPTNRSGT